MKKNNIGKKFIAFILAAVVLLVGVLFYKMKEVDLGKENNWENYIVLGKDNAFAVYEDKLALQIPYDVYLTKEKQLGDIVGKGNYEVVLETLNEKLPEKIEHITKESKRKVEIEAANKRKIPVMSYGDKSFILTSSLNDLFLELYYDEEISENQEIKFDILNANGKNGYARGVGEKLTKEFGGKYTAANFDNHEDYSYILNRNLSESKVEEIIGKLDEKYFKIKTEGELPPTLSDLTIVIGKEEKDLLTIVVKGEVNAEKTLKELKGKGYINLKRVSEKVEGTVIEYNKEDFYTAKKLGNILGIKNMIENNDLNEKIEVYIK